MDDPLSRLKWLRENWGEPSSNAARHVFKEAELQRQKHPARFSQTQGSSAAAAPAVLNWKSIGPTSANFETNGVTLNVVDSGRVRRILPHPTDPNTVYLLSAGGGLWKTTNFSDPNTTWVPKTDFIGSTSGGNVAFGKLPSTLYLGMGDPFDAQVGGLMLKSTDGGDSWSSPIFLSGATQVLDVKVDTSGPTDMILIGTDRGLFRSTDGATTFTQVASLSFGSNKVWSLVRTSAGWVASSQASGSNNTGITTLYLSVDNGSSWTSTGSGFSSAAIRTTLAVGDDGDSVVYALAGASASASTYSQLDLFRSIDGGQSWSALGVNSGKLPANPNAEQPDMNLLSGQAWYNQMILVDPNDASRNTVYLGGQLSSAKTTDGGTTWTLLSNWLSHFGLPYVHADMHTASFSKLNGVIFVGCDGGIFTTNDGGTTWTNSKNTGLVDQLVYSVSSSSVHTEQVLIGLQDDGTRFRVGNSTVYNQVIGGDGVATGWSQANDTVSIGTVQNGKFRVCHVNPPDDNSKFVSSQSGLAGSFPFGTPLTTPTAVADPTGSNFFTHGDFAIFSGMNTVSPAAFSWTTLFNVSVGFGFRGIHGIGLGTDLSHIGVAGGSGNLLLTTDKFAGWSTINLPAEVPGYRFFNSNVTYADNNTIYVTSTDPSIPAPVHVAKSTQGGAPGTWASAQNGLPLLAVERVLVDPRDGTGQSLYAATLLGVYYTTDGGANWQLYGTGLPQVRVTDLWVSPDGKILRAGTYGRGIWQIAPAATHFSVSAPTSSTAGSTVSVTVTPLDASNNSVTEYTGIIHFTSTDGQAALPLDGMLPAGGGSFSVTLKSAGSQTVTVVDTLDGSINGTSNAITVSSTSANHFLVNAPGSATTGDSVSFSVSVRDQFENLAISYSGTVGFTSSDPLATLPINSALTSGAGTFNATFRTEGSRTITAMDSINGSIAGVCNPIMVNTTFAFWRQKYFNSAQLNDSTISGDYADPDGDGLSNLLEYAFHSDPTQPSSLALPYAAINQTYLSLTYTKVVAATDLVYTVEQSPDLLSWNPVSTVNVILTDDGVTQTIKAQVPIGGVPKSFLRLRISH